MNAFIISNKNNNELVAVSKAGCKLCGHTALVLCGHMTKLLLTPRCVGRSIKQAQLQVM